MAFPSLIRPHAGDSLTLSEPALGRSPTDGWLLKARFVPRADSGQAADYTGSSNGDLHVLSLTAEQTAAWPVGGATLALWLERGADVWTMAQVQLDVLPNLRTATAGTDTRTLAQRTLDDLRAAFAAWSSTRGMQRKYKVNEREMEFNSAADILAQISYWEGEVAKEAEQARLAAGGKPRNRIKVRFTRPY